MIDTPRGPQRRLNYLVVRDVTKVKKLTHLFQVCHIACQIVNHIQHSNI